MLKQFTKCMLMRIALYGLTGVALLLYLIKPEWLRRYKQVGFVSRIFLYPVTSCEGISVQEAICTKNGLERGLVRDREFVVINAVQDNYNQQFVSSDMDKIHIASDGKFLLLTAPGMKNIRFPIYAPYSVRFLLPSKADGNIVREPTYYENLKSFINGCGQEEYGVDCGNKVAKWLNRFFGYHSLRMYRRSYTADMDEDPNGEHLSASLDVEALGSDSTLNDERIVMTKIMKGRLVVEDFNSVNGDDALEDLMEEDEGDDEGGESKVVSDDGVALESSRVASETTLASVIYDMTSVSRTASQSNNNMTSVSRTASRSNTNTNMTPRNKMAFGVSESRRSQSSIAPKMTNKRAFNTKVPSGGGSGYQGKIGTGKGVSPKSKAPKMSTYGKMSLERRMSEEAKTKSENASDDDERRLSEKNVARLGVITVHCESTMKTVNKMFQIKPKMSPEQFRANIVISGCDDFAELGWEKIRFGNHVKVKVQSSDMRLLERVYDEQTGLYRGQLEPMSEIFNTLCYPASSPTPLLGLKTTMEVKGIIDVGDPVYVLESDSPLT